IRQHATHEATDGGFVVDNQNVCPRDGRHRHQGVHFTVSAGFGPVMKCEPRTSGGSNGIPTAFGVRRILFRYGRPRSAAWKMKVDVRYRMPPDVLPAIVNVTACESRGS